jgi:acyl carrier protein
MLTKDEVVKRCRNVVVEQLGVNPDQVKSESKIVKDLGCDSLDVVELIMAIEEEFSIEIDDDNAVKMEEATFDECVQYLMDNYGLE